MKENGLIFKIYYPSGYIVDDISSDNLDVNVILENGEVYWATFFTMDNIKSIMVKERSVSFWAANMIIVEDLDRLTIRLAVKELMDENLLKPSMAYIGTIEQVFRKEMSFDDVIDMTSV